MIAPMHSMKVAAMFLAAVAGCSVTPRSAVSGAETFRTHCASCHGPEARGDGPLAATIKITVPDLRTLRQRNGGEFPADRVAGYIDGRNLPVAHGNRAMPVWGPLFDTTERLVRGAESAEQRIAAVIAYLETIQFPN
jgi:mono/diheme cytochrome c family protein